MSDAALAAPPAALARLAALAPLDGEELATLRAATKDLRRMPARYEILGEGEPIPHAHILLAGWACRTQTLSDGRRQIASLMLPGDLIGMCRHRDPVSVSAVLALTDVVLCRAPRSNDGSRAGLAEAYAMSSALDEMYLLRHITRLGRLSAIERTADFLLEMRERLDLCGLAAGNEFPMPLTQEMLADALGLTSVHVNRTLQALRRDGAVTFSRGSVTLHNPQNLARLADRPLTRVRSH